MGRVYYCSACQTQDQYENGTTHCATHDTISKVTLCATKEFIKNTLPNQMIKVLKEFHDFGDHDTESTRIPEVDSLTNQNQYNIISFSEYSKLVNTINATPAATNTNTIIGTYYQSLKEAINDYLVPSTRYYNSCDYSTQCCQSHCDHCCIQHCEGGDCTPTCMIGCQGNCADAS